MSNWICWFKQNEISLIPNHILSCRFTIRAYVVVYLELWANQMIRQRGNTYICYGNRYDVIFIEKLLTRLYVFNEKHDHFSSLSPLARNFFFFKFLKFLISCLRLCHDYYEKITFIVRAQYVIELEQNIDISKKSCV